ncbi:ferredoxin [Geodermatophilaceae bacterium NBWT11]|nr:ferredoxin [Geodermatophilaceae bacterium NBWT11]
MKVTVDWDLCDGNGVCAVEAPEHFEMTDDDELLVLKDDVSDGERAEVSSAVRVCPKRALALHD